MQKTIFFKKKKKKEKSPFCIVLTGTLHWRAPSPDIIEI